MLHFQILPCPCFTSCLVSSLPILRHAFLPNIATCPSCCHFFHILSCDLSSVSSHDMHLCKFSRHAHLSGVTTCPSLRSCLVPSSHILTPAFLSHLATCPPSDHASCFDQIFSNALLSYLTSCHPFRSCLMLG